MCTIHWIEIYPVDSAIDPTFEQLGPVVKGTLTQC